MLFEMIRPTCRYLMKLLLKLVLCWLIVQHATRAETALDSAQTINIPAGSKQYIQWAVTVQGDCQKLSQLPSALTKALLRDVQTLLRAARQDPATADVYKSFRAVLPDERFQPSCDRVKSRIPGDAHSAYVAIRIAVILQQPEASPPAHKLDSSLQSSVISQLNKGWSRCSAAFPTRVFTNLATTLTKARVSAVVNRASKQPVNKRTTIPLRELQPCVRSSSPVAPSPSPPHAPSPPSSPPGHGSPPGTTPPSESPSVDTSPSPPPKQVTCASIICAPGTLLKPNASDIIPTESTSTQLADGSSSESAQNICCDPDCSLVPGSVLDSSSCICSSSDSVKLLSSGHLTACLPQGVTCGAGAAAGYPVTVRHKLGVGPADACLTVNSSCPASLPVSFFRASVAGAAAQLVECGSSVSEYDGCKNFWGFTRRVEKQDGTLVGCLSNALATAKCPEEYGYGFAYWDADMKVLLCRPSSQQDCPYIGSLDNVQIWNAENKLIGCALISAEGRCPDEYPVFAKYSLDPPNNYLVQCRAANTGCPSSELYTRNFPFFLVEGTTLQGCLAPQAGFTTCSKYHAWNGVPVFGGVNNPSGCIARTASTCWPPNYLPYYDTSRSPPLLLQCHPPLQGQVTCQSRSVTIDNKQYLVNARRADGIIMGCLRSLYPCPNKAPADFPVYAAASWSARNFPVDCLARSMATCNVPYLSPRTFSLYRGTRTRLPKVDTDVDGRAALPVPFVEGCVEKSGTGPDDCTNPAYGSVASSESEAERRLFTAEVWGNADGTNLVGCVSSGKGTIAADNTRIGNPVPTPCPESQPFFLQSSGELGQEDYLTECRPAGSSTTCEGLSGTANNLAMYKVKMRSVTGEVAGCKELGYTPSGRHCPGFTGIATDLTSEVNIVQDLSDGAPYHFPLLVLQRTSATDATPTLAECRPYIGYSSFDYPKSCYEYGFMGSATVPVILGVSEEVYPDTYLGASMLAACTVSNARCPTTRDIGVAFRFIPMLTSSPNGAMVAACLWEHVLELQPCGGRFSIPVTTATDPHAALDSTNMFGCLAIGSAPNACANFHNNGFPFAAGSLDPETNSPGLPMTSFVQQITPAETSTLVRCASSYQLCQGPDYATPVYTKRTPVTVVGCVNGGGPTVDEIEACNLWAQRYYSSGTCRI